MTESERLFTAVTDTQRKEWKGVGSIAAPTDATTQFLRESGSLEFDNPSFGWSRIDPTNIGATAGALPPMSRPRAESSAPPQAPPPRDVVSQNILDAIDNAWPLRGLEDDWDGEGSPGIDAKTWDIAMAFLRTYAVRAWRKSGLRIDAPEIGAGPNGSIDLHWNSQKDRFVLLVNIRPTGDPSGPAGFYGRDNQGTTIKGGFDPEIANTGLLEWLMR